MKICTKSKAAKLLNVSRATIYAMIERGELVPNELGYVDLDQLTPDTDFSKPGRKPKEKAESYWTHCMYCGEIICGVEILEEYPDVIVLYAHKSCHEEQRQRHLKWIASNPTTGRRRLPRQKK